MKKRFKIVMSVVLLGTLTFLGCKTYKEGIGPKYYSAPKDFAVVNNAFFVDSAAGFQNNSIDFSQTKPHYFSAKFSSRVDWTIRIKGLKSGAYKILRGSSSQVDSTNAIWRGGHSGTFFFKKDEKCVAELAFLGTNMVLVDSFVIGKVFDFNRYEDGIIVLQGKQGGAFKGADFEGPFTTLKDGKINDFPQQFAFLEGVPYNLFEHPGSYNTWHSVGPEGSVEGNKCYWLEHTPDTVGKSQCDKQPYFAGAMQFRYNGKTLKGQAFNFLTDWNEPNNLWVNVYLYGDDLTMDSQFAFEFHEADASNEKNKSNKADSTLSYSFGGDKNNPLYCKARVVEGDNQMASKSRGYTLSNRHDPPSDDAYNYNFVPDTKGWKLYSHQMTEADRSTTPNNGCCGNKVMETNRIARVQLGIISKGKPFKKAKAIFDFAVVTKGGPFNPDKY